MPLIVNPVKKLGRCFKCFDESSRSGKYGPKRERRTDTNSGLMPLWSGIDPPEVEYAEDCFLVHDSLLLSYLWTETPR